MGRRKEVAGDKGLRWKKAWEARRRVGKKHRPSARSPERGTEVRIFKLDLYRGTGAQPDQLPNLTEAGRRKGQN